ncbi:hypothetical protein FC37_GL001526 [Lactobacillus gallinarum DSM 10532 = JCM 2011]|uniref:Uncharacterized protein n=1 Tax=Lactobacillus gallinarum DSM 10532 = JCM 2011 TaxID=1423748 RepID=A0A0R1NLE4_9LACO|nr:hypothetical protein FC37_GL001526 [Lactobacillus gallinarum DSM 10532 = JCM 2011]
MSKRTVNKTGTSGDKPNLITEIPKIANKAMRIIIDSVKETFCFFIFIPPNKKIPLTK